MRDYVATDYWSHIDFRKNKVVAAVLRETISFGRLYFPYLCYLGEHTQGEYIPFNIFSDIDRVCAVASEYSNTQFSFMREGDDYYALDIKIRPYDGKNIYGRSAKPNILNIQMDLQYFNDCEFVASFVARHIRLYQISRPYYGYSHESSDSATGHNQREWSRIYGKPYFCTLYWLNIFGPSVVANYGGKEKFLEAPCYRADELDDGGIMMLLYENPLNPESPEKRAVQNEVLRYFGLSEVNL